MESLKEDLIKDNLVWKLPEYLKKNQVSIYKLHKTIHEDSNLTGSRTTLYAWAESPPESMDLAIFISVLKALSKITGKNVLVSDLIVILEEA